MQSFRIIEIRHTLLHIRIPGEKVFIFSIHLRRRILMLQYQVPQKGQQSRRSVLHGDGALHCAIMRKAEPKIGSREITDGSSIPTKHVVSVASSCDIYIYIYITHAHIFFAHIFGARLSCSSDCCYGCDLLCQRDIRRPRWPTLGCVSPSAALMFKTHPNVSFLSACLSCSFGLRPYLHLHHDTQVAFIVGGGGELVEWTGVQLSACAARICNPSCWKNPPSLSGKHRAHRWPSEKTHNTAKFVRPCPTNHSS